MINIISVIIFCFDIQIRRVIFISTYKNFCKTALRLLKPNDVIYVTEKAINESLAGRPGPSWLEIPLNIQNELIKKQSLKSLNKKKKNKKILIKIMLTQIIRI